MPELRHNPAIREPLYRKAFASQRMEQWSRIACHALEASHLWLLDESGTVRWHFCVPGQSPLSIHALPALAARATRTGAFLFTEEHPEGSYAVVPLRLFGDAAYSLAARYPAGRRWSDADRERISEFADAVQRELEHAEEVAELRLESLAGHAQRDASNEGVLICTDEGEIVSYNQRFAEMVGLPADPDTADYDELLQRAADLVEEPGALLGPPAGAESDASPAEIRLKDGRVLERLDTTVQRHAAHGRVWVYRDVTQERRAREALLASEERYRALFEQAPMGVFVFDRDLVIQECNDSFVESLQSTRERLIGLDLTTLRDPRLQPAFLRVLAGESARYEGPYEATTSDARIWVEIHFSPLHDSRGEVVGGMGIVQDVTRRRAGQERLRRSEERFRQMAENIREVFWMVTPDLSETLYVSPAYEEVWGQSCESLYEDPLSAARRIHLEDRERILSVFPRVERGETVTEEYRIRRLDGETRWVVSHAAPVYDEEGRVYRVAGITEDITERKQAEATLEESEARLRLLVEQVPAILWTTDREIRFTSSEGAGLHGLDLDPDEVLGVGIAEFRTRFGSAEVALNAHRRALAGEHVSYTDAFADRSYQVHVEPLRDAEGVTVGTIGIALDVTAEREATEARERLAAILSATPDFVALVEPDGTARYVNPAGRRILGLAPDEPLRGLDLRTCHPLQLQGTLQMAMETAMREGTWTGEDALVAKDGREIPVSQVLVAHRDAEGRVEFLSTIMRDISEQRQLEAQLRQAQKMEAVGRLAGGVAHDFNNLLTAIKGNTELLLLDLASENPMRADLEEVRQAAERATDLTRQLLAFSRQQLLQPQVLNLNEVVSGTERLLRRVIGESVRLETRLEPALEPVRADPGQLEQVIMNLAVNARDAMPQGGVLTLETRNGELTPSDRSHTAYIEPGRYVILSVADTGEGISPEVRERIFEPFFTTKEQGKGTGLGLSTVYGIVKQSDGYVWVESTPGEGTRFDIYLPRVESEIRGESTVEDDGALEEGRETVLVVEDEPAVRSLARRILERSGYTVRVAKSGDAALRIVAKHEEPIHLLLTDVVMPGMSGRELAERMREIRPETQVLYMSGYTEEEIGRHGLRRESALIQKPFTPDELARRVRQTLHAAGQER